MRNPSLLLCCAMLCFGCSTSSRARYGTRAVYEQAERSWRTHGPRQDWLFTDPLTGCVLRCRADVEKSKPIAARQARATREVEGQQAKAYALTIPFVVPAAFLILPALGVYQGLTDDHPAARFHKRGDEAVQREALDEAADAYTLAFNLGDVVAGDIVARIRIFQGRTAEAVRVRQALICRGGRLGSVAWQEVESWLAEQGSPVPACADRATHPVDIRWLE